MHSVPQCDSDLPRQEVQKFYLHQAPSMKVEVRRNYEWLELGRGMSMLSSLKKKKPTQPKNKTTHIKNPSQKQKIKQTNKQNKTKTKVL